MIKNYVEHIKNDYLTWHTTYNSCLQNHNQTEDIFHAKQYALREMAKRWFYLNSKLLFDNSSKDIELSKLLGYGPEYTETGWTITMKLQAQRNRDRA